MSTENQKINDTKSIEYCKNVSTVKRHPGQESRDGQRDPAGRTQTVLDKPAFQRKTT